MMRIIEPCCATKQVMLMRDAIGTSKKTQFQGYGDLSLTELLPALLTRYSETEMMLVAPSIPDQAAEIVSRWMRKQWARMDGKGTLNVLSKLTIVADLSEGVSPLASTWVKENPFGSRLVLIDKAQEDTAILLPDIAITGPINLRYGKNFVCTATAIEVEVTGLWKQYSKLAKPKRTAKKKQTETPVEQESPSDMAEEKETIESTVESPSSSVS